MREGPLLDATRYCNSSVISESPLLAALWVLLKTVCCDYYLWTLISQGLDEADRSLINSREICYLLLLSL